MTWWARCWRVVRHREGLEDRGLNEFCWDALGGEWLCMAAGTAGTWQQVKPAAVVTDPSAWTA